MLVILSAIYLYVISPSVKFINNTNDMIRVTKGEFDSSKSDPDLNEVENMLRNTANIEPKNNYSYNISLKSLLSKKNIRVDASYEKEGEVAGERFVIDKNGFCKYTIIVYDDYTEIETSDFNICYKKLLVIK